MVHPSLGLGPASSAAAVTASIFTQKCSLSLTREANIWGDIFHILSPLAQILGTIFVSTTVQWTVHVANKNWLDFNKIWDLVQSRLGEGLNNRTCVLYEVIIEAEMGYKTLLKAQRMTDPPQIVLIHGCAQGQDGSKATATLLTMTSQGRRLRWSIFLKAAGAPPQTSSHSSWGGLRRILQSDSVTAYCTFYLAFTMTTLHANQESQTPPLTTKMK